MSYYLQHDKTATCIPVDDKCSKIVLYEVVSELWAKTACVQLSEAEQNHWLYWWERQNNHSQVYTASEWERQTD
jgi:hypothetical protein